MPNGDTDTVFTVAAEDMQGINDPSPAFRDWARDALLTGRLDIFVTASIQMGFANDVASALQYLADTSKALPARATRVGVADLTRRITRGYRMAKLKALLNIENGTSVAPNWRLGTIGHLVAHELHTGALLGHAQPPRKQVSVRQYSLFHDGDDEQHEAPLLEQKSTRTQLVRRLRAVARLWQKIAPRLEDRGTDMLGNEDWSGWQKDAATVARLRRAVRLFLPEHTKLLEETGIHPRGALATLTIMSWAAAAAAFHAKKNRTQDLFREVPVLAAGRELSGGQIDALEVRAIGGRPPTARDRRILRTIATHRFRSSGELLWRLYDVFRRPLDIVVIDWKFLIGDVFVDTHSSWKLPDLGTRPCMEHARQMRRYLTLIPLDMHLLRPQEAGIWSQSHVRLTGEIRYFMPHCLPIIHPLALTSEEAEQEFIATVVQQWGRASRRSRVRGLYNLLVAHLVAGQNGNSEVSGNGNGNGRHTTNGNHTAEQGELFTGLSPRTATSVVASYASVANNWVPGSYDVVEVVGTNGSQRYVMHFDRLLEAIGRGDVRAGPNFNPVDGGKIACLFPEHAGERTPSMQVYLDHYPPRFMCFGCERFGYISHESIPTEHTAILFRLQQVDDGHKAWERRQHHRMEFLPTEEHQAIMSVAQAILAREFPRSAGARYLAEKRCLDPDLAAQYGAGYGTCTLISELLDAGFSYDQLLKYGFLGISPRIPLDGPIVTMLEGRGMTLEAITRPLRQKHGEPEVPGLPYCTLDGRATFPLTLAGITNNIYGRAVFPCANKLLIHRKLSVQSQVMQGGFNMSVLDPHASHGEIIAVEGVMCALTLIQSGLPYVIAFIGVGNRGIMTEVVQSGKAVAIGFDIDETGRRKTDKLARTLREAGCVQPVRDFTEATFPEEVRAVVETLSRPTEEHFRPELKDFNDMLIHGRLPQAVR